jgi:hypothetical protein
MAVPLTLATNSKSGFFSALAGAFASACASAVGILFKPVIAIAKANAPLRNFMMQSFNDAGLLSEEVGFKTDN